MVNIVYMYVVYTSACMEEKLTIQTKHLNHDKNRHDKTKRVWWKTAWGKDYTDSPPPILEHTGTCTTKSTYTNALLTVSLTIPFHAMHSRFYLAKETDNKKSEKPVCHFGNVFSRVVSHRWWIRLHEWLFLFGSGQKRKTDEAIFHDSLFICTSI